MDLLLQGISTALLTLTLLLILGGGSSYIVDKAFFAARRRAVWSSYHHPWWDKDGRVRPKHLDCLECEIQVEKSGGELEGHSTLE